MLMERTKTVPTRTQALRTKYRSVLLAGLALVVLLTPISAMAAQRDGTVLFFSWEDLTQALSKPLLPDLSPSFLWQNLQSQANQEGPIERSYRWGHGLGVDGYAHPGARMPLWGY
jgi:hypothetical protein